ncbi:MAG: murein biosynthesis integral membrane protein MurJ [Coriobacteriia bacterium]|nr:murein biosynthesis integral membrane protein MurJ [Coriobacteriia bacterium]
MSSPECPRCSIPKRDARTVTRACRLHLHRPSRRAQEPDIATPSVARSTAMMSASTLVSRLTGFMRTWAMGYALGLTVLADSYDIANNLPNMLFELLAGGVLSSVFIPLFMERMKKDGEQDAWKFASYVLNIIVLVLGAIALVATLWPDPFVRSQTLTISAERSEVAIWLFRFFAVQIVFYGMGLVFTGVLNSYRRFLAPAVAPVFNNLVVTVTLLGFYVPFRDSNPQLALTGLAVGTTLGVVTMAAVQIPSILKLGGRYTPRIDWRHPGIVTIGAKMVPTLIYVVTNLVSVTFRTNFAVATGEGGQAALRYAWQFYQLPYGIFAVALATAIFPELAERANARDMSGFKQMFARGLRSTMVLIVPLAGLLATLATPVITLYQAGRFTADDVPVVAGVLSWWALGLTFYAGYMFVLKSFYSLQDTRTPMYTNIVATTIHIVLYAVLARGIAGWDGLGIIGIPIADGIFFCGHLLALSIILRKRIGALDGRAIAWTFVKVVASSVAGAAAAWLLMQLTAGLADIPAGFIVQLFVAGTGGLVVAYGAMALLRVPELGEVAGRLTKRFGRRRVES